MKWSRIKDIILGMLLVVNLILLGLVIQRRQEVVRYEEELRSGTVAVLSQNGIALSEDIVPWEDVDSAWTLVRSAEQEAAVAQGLLGECEKRDDNPDTYANETGSARFRTSGEVQVQYYTSSPFDREGAGEEEEQTLEAIQTLGLSGTVTWVEQWGTEAVVTVRQTWNNRPIFDCELSWEYQDGRLEAISGKWLFGSASGSSGETRSSATLLIYFMGEVVSKGEVCNEILAVETGYTTSAGMREAIRLSPVWRITTDTGLFEVDAVEGTCKRLS